MARVSVADRRDARERLIGMLDGCTMLYTRTSYSPSRNSTGAIVELYTVRDGEIHEVTAAAATAMGERMRETSYGHGIHTGGGGYSRGLHVASAVARVAGRSLAQGRRGTHDAPDALVWREL